MLIVFLKEKLCDLKEVVFFKMHNTLLVIYQYEKQT